MRECSTRRISRREEIAVLGPTGSRRIDTLVLDLVERSAAAGDIVQSEEVGSAMLRLRKFMFQRVYLTPDAQRELPRVERMLQALFEHYAAEPAGVRSTPTPPSSSV